MPTKKLRKSAFVPKLLVRTAIAGVVPACALGCGGNETVPPDTGAETPLGVAAVAYPAYEAGQDVFSDLGGVAYPAYEAGEGGTDAPADGPRDVRPDIPFTVAAVAYPAYEAGRG
jgi:hypothetical protein